MVTRDALITDSRAREHDRGDPRRQKYERDWKINLIERDNPHWNDLYMALVF